MINRDLLLNRLSTIKFLYKIAVEQSRQSETVSFFSILTFHDSVEMFLKLAAEHRGINSTDFNFLQYWDKMPDLTLKESMRNLNARRVNLKHKGLLPAKIEVETSRVNSSEFFEQNTPVIFGVEFADISLFEMVIFDRAKELLISSQEALEKNDTEKSVTEATIAFYSLLDEYKENKKGDRYKTHFDFTERISVNNYSWDNKENKDRRVDEVVKKINENFEKLDQALAVISLGIDYRKYAKFKILTPSGYKMMGGEYRLQLTGEKNWSIENSQFLIDFVLESALKLQEFDFDYGSLDVSWAKLQLAHAENRKRNYERRQNSSQNPNVGLPDNV